MRDMEIPEPASAASGGVNGNLVLRKALQQAEEPISLGWMCRQACELSGENGFSSGTSKWRIFATLRVTTVN
jgi:hypothetical protein